MKIKRQLVPEQAFEAFADEHRLTLIVVERRMDDWQRRQCLPRFYAHFKDVEVKDGHILRGEFGNGHTEDEAIADYAAAISGAWLVVDAYGVARREIQAPRLIVPAKAEA